MLERAQARLDVRARARARGNASLQVLDLALALQHAVQLRLRAVEDHALAAEEVARAVETSNPPGGSTRASAMPSSPSGRMKTLASASRR